MLKMSRKVKCAALVLFCAFFMGAVMAQATTYYVATTGLDSNRGTADSPFLTIQKGINAATAAGDIVTVADGIYTVATGPVGYITGTAGNGAPGNPISIKSTNPRGAHIVLQGNTTLATSGFYVERNYWVIDGFDISGGVSGNTNAGIVVYSTGTVIKNNTVHHIARTSCSESTNGNAGVYTGPSAVSTLIENNVFYSIGRLLNGENGCVTTKNAHDHGIYIEASNGITAQRNCFYDVNRGWPIHVYNATGSTANNVTIFNNTFADKSPLGATGPAGHILLAVRVTNAQIKNNISYTPYIGMVRCSNLIATSIVIDHNLSDQGMDTLACGTTSGVTMSQNLTGNSPGFVSAANRNYTLASGSSAIDKGAAIAGITYSGSAPDIGAYEFSGQVATLSPPVNLRVQ